ncbi:hypothetical protein PGT21_026609 [Puccinia graminis f. sp. tritici]|uniref:Uncharacterized protein n=1 Tax=Puccinia graminis f. sp. tritici TaxID=56615 RepID=A0A5B0NFC2_PUCGR|nr:hypothetical protein PGT21_026609 [Puccinia graminis f. sp. tritici]
MKQPKTYISPPVSDPSSKTSNQSPWGQSIRNQATKDSRNRESKKDNTASPTIAHRFSKPNGPTLLARIDQSTINSTTATELNFCCLLSEKHPTPTHFLFRSQLNLSGPHLKAALKAPSLQPTAYRLTQ